MIRHDCPAGFRCVGLDKVFTGHAASSLFGWSSTASSLFLLPAVGSSFRTKALERHGVDHGAETLRGIGREDVFYACSRYFLGSTFPRSRRASVASTVLLLTKSIVTLSKRATGSTCYSRYLSGSAPDLFDACNEPLARVQRECERLEWRISRHAVDLQHCLSVSDFKLTVHSFMSLHAPIGRSSKSY